MFRENEIVLSLAGRDKGQLMAVIRSGSEGIWLADGKRRPIERPKQKNPRHLRPLGIELGREAMTTNCALRRALREIADSAKYDA